MLINHDTVATLQRERYAEFVRQAEVRRLLRAQNEAGNAQRTTTTTKQTPTNLWAVLQQWVQSVLPVQSRALPPR
ncbi:MAG: hypothetical protein R3C14_52450 [Caldilineaceae bacterium]